MVLRRRDVTAAAVAVFIAWGYTTSWLPALRWLMYAFVAGAIVAVSAATCLGLFVSRGISTTAPGRSDRTPLSAGLSFLSQKQWVSELAALKQRQEYHRGPIGGTPSAEVSGAIDQMLALVTKEYVGLWYGSISTYSSFPNEVDRAMRHAIAKLVETLQRVDVAEALTSRMVPILTAHFRDFYDAERAVRGRRLNKATTDSEELDFAIASKFRDGRLHVSATLSFPDTRLIQQEHLRGICSQLLPRLLPAKMISSGVVLAVVREIVTCAVLFPILQAVSDPDTWNQLMEMYGRSMLQDRSTVRKLRAALDEHALPAPKPMKPSAMPRLLPGESERRFEKFVRAIRRTNNLSDARRLRSEIASQLKRDSLQSGPDPTYLRRLEMGKRLLDQKIQDLAAAGGDRQARVQGVGLSAGDERHQVTPSGRPTPTPTLRNSSLVDILRNSSGLSYFMEYMDRQRLLPLVQFWLVVDGFRNPLEEDTHDEGEDEDAHPGHTRGSAITNSGDRHDRHDAPEDRSRGPDGQRGMDSALSMWTEADREDLEQIDRAYLSRPELRVSPSVRHRVRAFLDAGSTATPAQYHRARHAILSAQSAVLKEMQTRHFANFQNSDLFYKHLASHDTTTALSEGTSSHVTLSELSGNGTLEPGTAAEPRADVASWQGQRQQSERDASRNVQDRGSSDTHEPAILVAPPVPDTQVIQAMEQALNTIMEDSRPETAQGLRMSLFGSESGRDDDAGWGSGSGLFASEDSGTPAGLLFDRPPATPKPDTSGKPSLASLGLVSAASRIGVFVDDDLFGDEDGGYQSDGHEEGADQLSDEDEADKIHEAAPGDLGLAEAIAALASDIDRLAAQDAVVDSLTRKAELTNNTAELRILRKSKASLQREMRRKELQRQQYVVQESDNSLYGRSTASIKSVQVGQEEDGREFALYLVEVQRDAGEQMPTASWVVARRYSEFHELHQKLRSRYASVRGLDFPPRRVVMKFQSEFLRKRRQALENYLRGLLLLPDVCRSRELRAFLSQSSITAGPGTNVADKEDRKDMMSRLYDSVADGMDDFLGNIAVIDQLSLAGQNLIAAATSQFTSGALRGPSDGDLMTMATAAEAEAELEAFDDKEIEPFIKPICDIFLEVFELNRGNNWLRGRAVVMVLQQLMGGTIERKVRDNVRLLAQDDSILRGIELVRDALFPSSSTTADDGAPEAGQGAAEPPPPMPTRAQQPQLPRTEAMKKHTRTEASLMLATLIPELAASVVGRLNAQAASRRIFATLNNSRLNTHLAFTLLDEIVSILLEQGPG